MMMIGPYDLERWESDGARGNPKSIYAHCVRPIEISYARFRYLPDGSAWWILSGGEA